MNYTDYQNAIMTIFELPIANPALAAPSADPAYNLIYPRAIDYTENRLQRDLDFLQTIATDDTGNMTAGNRTLALPVDLGTFIVTTEITPIVSGQRGTPLLPMSRQSLDYAFPASQAQGLPLYWAPGNQATVIVGPAPDQNYGFEAVGTVRFTQLSATNTSNFLTLQLPDLYVAATCVFMAGYQRDFGAQSENPQLSLSWEATYQSLLKSATVEEARKKFQGKSPSNIIPTPPPST